jgi:uncharacterized membrane protein YfcA
VSGLDAAPLGLLVGLALGSVGAGGTLLMVPILVAVAGETAATASTTSLLVVGLASGFGAIPHRLAGRVDLRAGAGLGAAGVAGALVGSLLGARAPDRVLLLGLALVAACAGSGLLVHRWGDRGDAVWRRAPSGPGTFIAVGTAVGVLTGFLGVGGGFLVVPALVLLLGYPMRVATGTSLVVITLNCSVALAARIATTGVDWGTALPFAVTAVAGALAGGHLGGRLDSARLRHALALGLLVVAAYAGGRAALA